MVYYEKGCGVMYYIISPIPVENLKKYQIPFVARTYTRDMTTFCTTDNGKEFLQINPLRISHEHSKSNAISNVAIDVAWIGLCYNIPLYIAFMTESAFHNTFDLGMARYTNFDKCTKMQRENRYAEISKAEQYFQGDYNSIVNACNQHFKFNLSNTKIIQYRLAKNTIEEIPISV